MIKHVICVVIECDRCQGWMEAEAPMHYATEADARKYLTAEGWRITGTEWVCRPCAAREDCQRDGHRWATDPLLSQTMCERCGTDEQGEWIRQVLNDIDTMPEQED